MENSCKIRHYESFWKSILIGSCICHTLDLVPLFAEGMSPGVAIARLTNNPLKMVSVLQIMCITGLVFGCVASFFSWIGRRNREREETDELMREYLKKKLQEENEKQY